MATRPNGQWRKQDEDKRILGIFPNYKTVPTAAERLPPLSTKAKFHLAAQDSFDWSTALLAGFYAGVSQLSGQSPAWGMGAKGYGKRFAAASADQVIGNFLTEAAIPALAHDDPRYYRLGAGSARRRVYYAVSRIWRIRSDTGEDRFNYPELAGNAAAVGIGELYYPAQDRSAGNALQKYGFQLASDAGFNVLKEFWPEIRSKLLRQRARRDDGVQP